MIRTLSGSRDSNSSDDKSGEDKKRAARPAPFVNTCQSKKSLCMMPGKLMLTLTVSYLRIGLHEPSRVMEGAARACAPDTQGAAAMAQNSGFGLLVRLHYVTKGCV